MQQGKRDILSGGVLLVISIALYLIIPGQVETLEGDTLTPASMPMAIVAIIAALSLCLMVIGFRQRVTEENPEPLIPDGSAIYIGGTAVVTLGYVAAIPIAGYIGATAVALFAFSRLFGNRNWKHILIMVIVAPPAILLFFRYTMLVLLPQGIWFE